MPEVILASASPRRRELLESAGVRFRVAIADVDESRLPGESPREFVERLSRAKAEKIANLNRNAWIIGADTDVLLDDEIIGKPNGASDAERILTLMQGRVHTVWGAFTLLNLERGVSHTESHETLVKMIEMSSEIIQKYIRTGEPLDKAGAYAIQGIGAQYIFEIHGSHTNVVGLNVSALISAMRRHGIFD